jgi:hypothetical protein
VSNLHVRTWDAIKAPRAAGGKRDRGGPAPQLSDPTATSDVARLFRERHTELVRLAALVVGDRPTAEDVVGGICSGWCTTGFNGWIDRETFVSLPPADGRLAYEAW